MGRDITLIITKETELKIPSNIPHIIEDNLLLIAFENNEFSNFVKRVLKSQITDLFYYFEEYEFVKLIKNLNIKSFLAFHESDFGDVPIEEVHFAVLNNDIILESIESLELDFSKDPFLYKPTNKVDAIDILEMNSHKVSYIHDYFDFLERYNNFKNTK